MTFASAIQFHIPLLWVSLCLKCENGSSRFQSGEGPSRGLLHEYTSSKFAKVLFEALDIISWAASDHGILNGNEEKKKV